MTVDQIIKYYGGKTLAAVALGYTLQSLRDWRKAKNGIPLRTQCMIEIETGGRLKAERKRTARA